MVWVRTGNEVGTESPKAPIENYRYNFDLFFFLHLVLILIVTLAVSKDVYILDIVSTTYCAFPVLKEKHKTTIKSVCKNLNILLCLSLVMVLFI